MSVRRKDQRGLKLLGVSVLFCVFGFYVFALFERYTADIHYERAQVLLGEANYKRALYHANRSIDLNSMEPNYYRIRAKTYLLLTVASPNEENRTKLKFASLTDMKTALALNFDNLVTMRNLIPLYYFLSLGDYSLSSAQKNIDENFINITRQYYTNLKRNFSHDVGVLVTLANYERKLGLADAYEESVVLVRALRPDILEWHESFVPLQGNP